MNIFYRETKKLIDKHGVSIKYKSKVNSVYNVETSSSTDTVTEYSLIAYPKNIEATQWYYPSLVGKKSVMFYIISNQLFTPSLQDSIEYNGVVYNVHSYQEHVAGGALTLYRVIGVQ